MYIYICCINSFWHKGNVVGDLSWSTQDVLRRLSKHEAGLQSEPVLRHQGLHHRRVTLGGAVLQLTVLPTQHKAATVTKIV